VILGALTADAVMASLATDGQYTAFGDSAALPVRVVLSRDVERITETAIIRQTEATLRRSINPRRGALLTVGSESWRVGDVQKDDGYLVVVALKPYRAAPEPDDE
jgi:hypothetical protein